MIVVCLRKSPSAATWTDGAKLCDAYRTSTLHDAQKLCCIDGQAHNTCPQGTDSVGAQRRHDLCVEIAVFLEPFLIRRPGTLATTGCKSNRYEMQLRHQTLGSSRHPT